MISRTVASRSFRQLSVAALNVRTTPCHVRLISAFSLSRTTSDILLPKPMVPNLQSYRCKSKKKSSTKKAQDSDDEGDIEDDDEDNNESSALAGEKEKVFKVAVLRLDKLVRHALGNSSLLEETFLAGKLWRNDLKVLKKAAEVNQGDIISLERGPDPKNPNFILVHRIEVIEVKESNPYTTVRVLISKNLAVKPFKD